MAAIAAAVRQLLSSTVAAVSTIATDSAFPGVSAISSGYLNPKFLRQAW